MRLRPYQIVSLFALVAVLLAGCGGNSNSGGGTAAPGVSPTAGATGSQATGTCAKAGTRSFAKTRFVVDAGLAFGAFHRYIYRPYREGRFQRGVDGRTGALIKAGLAAAFAVNRLNAAKENAEADPTLCKLVPNMDSIRARLAGLAGSIRGGNTSGIDGLNNSVDGLQGQLQQRGTPVPDRAPSIPGVS